MRRERSVTDKVDITVEPRDVRRRNMCIYLCADVTWGAGVAHMCPEGPQRRRRFDGFGRQQRGR